MLMSALVYVARGSPSRVHFWVKRIIERRGGWPGSAPESTSAVSPFRRSRVTAPAWLEWVSPPLSKARARASGSTTPRPVAQCVRMRNGPLSTILDTDPWGVHRGGSARALAGLASSSVEAVAFDEVVDVRPREIEPLRRFGDVPACRLERLLQKLALESVRLLLEAHHALALGIVVPLFQLKMKRLDLEEAVSRCADHGRFDGVRQLADVARPLGGFGETNRAGRGLKVR